MQKTRKNFPACPALLFAFAGAAFASPPPSSAFVLPNVPSFRITDIEQIPGDPGANAFNIEFEALNWTSTPAAGLALMANVGSSAALGGVPGLTGNGIDANGRGGPTSTDGDIGDVLFDPVAIQSGRGRGDIAGATNDWVAIGSTATSAVWDASVFGGTAVPDRDLLGAGTAAGACALVPGCVLDGGGNPDTSALDTLGDVAIDGGPGIAVNPVAPNSSGNVLDGFVLSVDDFDEGDVLSFNWFLLDANGDPIGNAFGFGVFNLGRIPVGGALPGPVFVGNTGMGQSNRDIYDTAYLVPGTAEFAVEFGNGLTGAFLDPGDNFVNAPVNADLIGNNTVPEPATLPLLAAGAILARRRARASA